jgi:hypothetical protein
MCKTFSLRWKNYSHVIAWTMQQVHIPVSPVANVLMISAAWRKVHTGRNFFQFLHGSSQWTLSLKRDAS